MTAIQILAPEVADGIAAGEVIERPASVVRELIGNPLDATARRISVDVRGAGRTSIRVSDDGAGIPAEELPLAFVRHATSKVAALSDLDAITSLGFRGEALASIASVADVEASSNGARIHIRAGAVVEQGAGPLLTGVTVEVRDLFANVPARLKFLKSDATENAAIKDVVIAFALLHPHVRFQLGMDGRSTIGSGGDGDRSRAFASVQGAEVAAEMLEIVGLPLVTGMVSQPKLSRGTRDGIVLAVNGRPITSRPLAYALEDCYQGRLERGRHPVAAIDIGIDAALVDVNVHPAKREVRLREEAAPDASGGGRRPITDSRRRGPPGRLGDAWARVRRVRPAQLAHHCGPGGDARGPGDRGGAGNACGVERIAQRSGHAQGGGGARVPLRG